MAEETLATAAAATATTATHVQEEKAAVKETAATATATSHVQEEKADVEEPATADQAIITPQEEPIVTKKPEDVEKEALAEFRKVVYEAFNKHEFVPPPPPPPQVEPEVTKRPIEDPAVKIEEEAAKEPTPVTEEQPLPVEPTPTAVEDKSVIVEETKAEEAAEPTAEVFIWGVPLVGDEKTDTVLLKFLRARDFKAKDAMEMIKSAVIWRKQFGIDEAEAEAEAEADDSVPLELEQKVVFMHGQDRDGHPVCYNVYGEFQDKDLYSKVFGDEEKRLKFLKWRIKFLEKGIRSQLDFAPGGVSSMVQVTDLKNVPGPGKREFRLAANKALVLLQDNYPEFVAKQIFINVPWWYLAYNRMISSIFSARSKSKFVFAGPTRSAETLFKYITPEQVPVQYGGLSKDNDTDFSTADAATEVTIKPTAKHIIAIPVTEKSVLVWELRVLGWEVIYGSEFVPDAEDGYTVIVTKATKLAPTDEPVVKNSFKIGEAGKIVLTIDNATSKKKKLLYRYKAKSSSEST